MAIAATEIICNLCELHYQFDLSRQLGFAVGTDAVECEEKIIEAEKILNALIKSFHKDPAPSA